MRDPWCVTVTRRVVERGVNASPYVVNRHRRPFVYTVLSSRILACVRKLKAYSFYKRRVQLN